MQVDRTTVYKFYLKPPTENAHLIDETLFQGHVRKNELIAVARAEKEALWELDSPEIKKMWDDLQPVYEERRAIRDEISDLRRKRPKGDAKKTSHQAKIDRLREKGKALTRKIKNTKKELSRLRGAQFSEIPGFRDKYNAVKKTWSAIRKEARQGRLDSSRHPDLYRGTEEESYRASESSRKKSKGLPRFQRWDGEGCLGIQLQNKQTQAEVFGGRNTFCQIKPVDPNAWDPSIPKGQRKPLQRTTLRVRIQSEGKRKTPVWGSWPMLMHRPLPEGAVITHVRVTREKQANYDRWFAHLQVKTPQSWTRADEFTYKDGMKAVALDFGWRATKEGELRIGYWVDTDGDHGEISLPGSLKHSHEFVQSKQGQRDQNRDALLEGLLEDLGDRDKLHPEVREFTRGISKWRSNKKLHLLLCRHWPNLPEAAWERLEAWAYLDTHHWQVEAGNRCKIPRRRNDIYAKLAAEWVQKYDVIILEGIELRNLAKNADPESKADLPNSIAARNNGASRNRVRAAPAAFKQALINACARTDTMILKVPAQNTSKVCADCGHKNKLTKEMMQTCKGCGVVFDRDYNAARNILARGLDVIKDPESLAKVMLVEKPKEGMYHRGKKE